MIKIDKLIESIEYFKKSIELGLTKKCILEYLDTLLDKLKDKKESEEK